ncbi:hypothetical protein [Sulfitobacter sp. R18_1]|uniref:hypothetical protein n=1 Tax=Sulfitobacter sp. R18_1 TaxID=2821104 RepID=UPI001ADCD98C|nr:hypothetical protein [Sulfitobacter sp. R18_1]MBO9428706.1 hypothetical protein [Sulfitobacter sp. R18_1]
MRKRLLIASSLILAVSACGLQRSDKISFEEFEHITDSLSQETDSVEVTYNHKPKKLSASTYLMAEGDWHFEYAGDTGHKVVAEGIELAGLIITDKKDDGAKGEVSAKAAVEHLYGGPVHFDLTYEILPDALSVGLRIRANGDLSKKMAGRLANKIHRSIETKINQEKMDNRVNKSAFFKLPWQGKR